MKAVSLQVHLMQVAACVPFVLLAAACSHTLPEYAANPPAPPQHSVAPSAAPLPASQSPESVVPVTLTGDLTPIQSVVNNAIPSQFDEKGHPLGVDFKWRFVPDGDPQVSIQGGRVTIHAAYKGEIEGKVSARGCRLDPVYPILNGTADIGLRQEGDSLVVGLVNPQINVGLKPESDTQCNMFNVPLKDQLPELLDREGLKRQITEAVNKAGLKIRLQPVWESLQGPMTISIVPMNTQLCVYGNPSEMAAGTLEGSQQEAVLTVVAKANPTTDYQNVCKNAIVSPARVTQGSTAPGAQTFKILAKIPVPYSSLTATLQEKLFHSEVSLKTLFGDKLVIEKASAADANGKVLIAIHTSGDLKGTIYYSGTPQLAAGGALMTVPDLQMDTASKKMLDSVKVGYWQLVDSELKPKVQTAAKVDLSEQLVTMRAAMTGQHKTGNLMTEIKILRQQAERAYSTPDALVADILFEGTESATGRLMVESGSALAGVSDRGAKLAVGSGL